MTRSCEKNMSVHLSSPTSTEEQSKDKVEGREVSAGSVESQRSLFFFWLFCFVLLVVPLAPAPSLNIKLSPAHHLSSLDTM